MDNMTKEESYADRRQLFKYIWETAMQIDEKDVDTLMGKTKVIKTLRLDEVDRCVIGKKKERIKNLRTVCKKILDFCDRQDADNMFFEQKPENKDIADGEALPLIKLKHNLKKIKADPKRKKVMRAKNLYVPKKSSGPQVTSERKDDYPRLFTNSSRNNRRTTFNVVQRASVQRRALKVKSNLDPEGSNAPNKESTTRHKVPRQRRIKRKKSTAPNMTSPGPSGIDW